MRARNQHAMLPALLVLTGMLSAAAQQPVLPSQPLPASSRPRLVEIKVDGLSPWLLDALIDPDDPAKLARLPDPEGFHRAIARYRAETGRREVIPNLRRYFYDQGVRVENMVAATVTLSSVSWSIIETGQPSVIKRHMTFSRQTGYLRSHLDGFRDSFNIVMHSARKTNAVWELDQAGVSLFADAFHPQRVYITPWMYYRNTPQAYLADMGKHWLTNGEKNLWGMARSHLARRVDDMNYPEWAQEFGAALIANKILERDFAGQERYDYISVFMTIDHQFHVDPSPGNIVRSMARMDRRIGRILTAVEQSERREQTLVVVLSDHGSEFATDTINLSFPLTRIFRTRLFGHHNVSTVMVEDAAHALSAPMQGIDFPRLYESPYSPYNKGKGAEWGYSTAFVDNFGNARAEVHLRNNDLNRLHLLLKALKRKLNNDQRAALREKMEDTLAGIHGWLGKELIAYRDYHQGVKAWLPFLLKHADSYWRDAGARLKSEWKRDEKQLRGLARLEALSGADDPIAWLRQNTSSISKLIPRKYFGPSNAVRQLSRYTLGLDDDMQWVETTLDPRGQTVSMDYFEILSNFEAPNPPRSYERNPIALMATALPVEPITDALRSRGWLPEGVRLKQAVWAISTAKNSTERGGQALVLKSTDERVRYLPIRNLSQDKAGGFTFEPSPDLDPFGLYYDPEFRTTDGLPAYLWMQHFRPYKEWVNATYATQYTIAPLVFLDIAGDYAKESINNPEFQKTLTGFPDEESKQRYLRGLRWKYASQNPDLLLWSSYLWNFSSKSHTAGGSHGGLPPAVARTSFLLWGGKDFQLPAGGVVSEPATTLDVVPTLADLLGMRDADGAILRQPGSYRHRPLLRLAGTPLPILPAKPQTAATSAPATQSSQD